MKKDGMELEDYDEEHGNPTPDGKGTPGGAPATSKQKQGGRKPDARSPIEEAGRPSMEGMVPPSAHQAASPGQLRAGVNIDAPPSPDLARNAGVHTCCKDHPSDEVLFWEYGPVEVKCQTEPYHFTCYKCKESGITQVTEGPSKLSWIMCFILFALGFWCCCFIPVLPCAKKWGFRDH